MSTFPSLIDLGALVATYLRQRGGLDNIDGQGLSATVSTDPEEPSSADQVPLVQVLVVGSDVKAARMAGASAGSFDETVLIDLHCWAFSAAGPEDALRQAERVAWGVRNAILANLQLDGATALATLQTVRLIPPAQDKGGDPVGRAVLRYALLRLG